MSIRLISIGFTLLAFWPMLQWYVQRLFDKSDEALGLLGLATAVIFAIIGHKNNSKPLKKENKAYLICSLLCVAAYAFLFHKAPNLILAIIMTFALWFVLSSEEKGSSKIPSTGIAHPAILGLLLLSLPIVASCNFYLAYPLRVAVAWFVADIFKLYGVTTEVIGTSICLNNQQINIDLPCSGVHFLWFAAYLSLLIAGLSRASLFKTARVLAFGGLCAFLANVVRALLISLLSVEGFSSFAHNSLIHQGIGILIFSLVAFLILKFFRLPEKKSPGVTNMLTESEQIFEQTRQMLLRLNKPPIGIFQLCYCLVCLIAICVPFVGSKQIVTAQYRQTSPILDRLEKNYERDGVFKKVALSEQEKQFQMNFPGVIDKYSDGRTELILRRVYLPTRQLHPISDCLRGDGCKVISEGIKKDDKDADWNELLVQVNGHALEVNERILDEKGNSWVQVSDWYWGALLGQTKGPWLSITKIKAAQETVTYLN